MDEAVAAFLSEYARESTRKNYRQALSQLSRYTGAENPTELRPETVTEWCTELLPTGEARSNNSVRNRVTAAAVFLGWCNRSGIPAPSPDRLKKVKRSHPPVYGKKQSKYAERFLTHDEAGRLIAAARSNRHELVALMHEIVVRLGLTGMRAGEIANLRWGNLRLDPQRPELHWMGKGNRPRTVTAPTGLVALLADWSAHYEAGIGRKIGVDDHIISPQVRGKAGAFSFGDVSQDPHLIWKIITHTAKRAGIGHVAPHDLRRSAAAILHRDTDDNGRHRFDLLDIQRVLGHADPAVTMKCYLEPLARDTLDAAADTLDW